MKRTALYLKIVFGCICSIYTYRKAAPAVVALVLHHDNFASFIGEHISVLYLAASIVRVDKVIYSPVATEAFYIDVIRSSR